MTRPRSRSPLAAVLLTAMAALVVGCGGGDDDITRQGSGNLQWRPSKVSFASVSLGATETKTLTLENSGDSDLRIFRTKFRSKGDASVKDLSISNLPDGGFTLAPEETRELEIEYAPRESGRTNAGILELYNSGASSRDDPAEIEISTGNAKPRMNVVLVESSSAEKLRFKPVPVGQRETQHVEIYNVGDAPLEIYDAVVSGSGDFQVKEGSEQLPMTLESTDDVEATEGGEDVLRLALEYAPTDGGSSAAELVIKSNVEPGSNEQNPSLRKIPMDASAQSACLLVDGTVRNLGAVPLDGSITEVVTAENCGSETLEISKVEFADDPEEFSLSLGRFDGNGDGELDEPIEIEELGEAVNFSVEYEPQDEGTDRATVVLHSNDPAQSRAEIELIARGARGECPRTDVVARPDTDGGAWGTSITAAPLDYVLLDASNSEDPDGRITDYTWRVLEKPEEATVRLGPWKEDSEDENKAKRRFRLLTAGTYRIGLTLEDNEGFRSCSEGEVKIRAIPDEKVHVELTWTNPEDPDETDDTGSDVDVHMAKMGPGRWFEHPYDLYYEATRIDDGEGGSVDWKPETPSLDIDDKNGAGPENIQMDDPQECQWYAVGVHYYAQRFGTAYATVRIYINERLVFEKFNKPLTQGGQFWDVARIHWPSGQIVSVGETQPAPPIKEEPAVTERMENARGPNDEKLCTRNDLYPTDSTSK